MPARKPAPPRPSVAVAPGIQKIYDGSGSVSYKAQFRARGHAHQTRRFPTLEMARAWKRGLEAEAAATGHIVDKKEAAKHTVGDLLNRYSAEVSSMKRGGAIEQVRLKALQRDPLAKLNVLAVSGKDMHAWLDRRKAAKVTNSDRRVSAATINRELNLLHHVFEKARKAWAINIDNPASLIERPPASKHRERRISEAEVEAIGQATGSPTLLAILTLAIETSMRRGEILSLSWTDVDLRKRVAQLHMTKNGTARRVPLSMRAIEVLDALPWPADGSARSGRIFEVDPHSVSTAMRRAVTRARARYVVQCQAEGLEADPAFLVGVRLHDGRHEGASRLVEAGVDQMTTAKLLGHKSLAMTMRYYNPGDEHLLAAIDKVSKAKT